MSMIGVAVAVPEPWGSELREYRARTGDSSAAWIPTHITLVPPVEVDDVARVATHLAAAAAQVQAFEVHLRGTGTFRPVSPVVFVNVVRGISQCEQLAAMARSGPLAVDLEFPYHPHVTVAHHLDDEGLDRAFAELAGFECEFEVEEFHLYLHDDHVGWRPTREFALRTPAPAWSR